MVELRREQIPAPPAARIIGVGIGEVKVTRDSRAVLVAYGVGSCVSVCAFSSGARAAGMAHILLPGDDREKAAGMDTRCAGAAIPRLVEGMKKKGADERKLIFKIAGGASALKVDAAEKQMIGARNVREVRKILGEMNAAVAVEDVGGSKVRTVRFYAGSGEMVVTSLKQSAGKKGTGTHA